MKLEIKKILRRYEVYYFMPVQMGMGASGLDFHCVVLLRKFPLAFFIEAKAPGKQPTPRQSDLRDMLKSKYNARVFIVDGSSGLRTLEAWLIKVQNLNEKV